jgi:hypothetical protein
VPDYRLFMMTGDGRIQSVAEFASHDDSEAIHLAEHRRKGAAAELWSLKRRIRVFRAEPSRQV